ncbi:hypothetical protein [Corynebacterium variabile]|uniref:hypothetical protein n=1 Tax=Corynebacterium variabile TaxID=1727 RepID=UPI003F94EEB9
MTLKMSRVSRGAATMILAAATAGSALVVAPAAAAQDSPAPTDETTCKDAATISVLAAFDQMTAETKAGIPAQFASMFDTNVNNLRASLVSTNVAYVDVSRDASEINAEAEDNEDPYANFAVARLDKIRNGEADAVVAFQDLTLSEVVETLVLGMYTFTVPLDVVAAGMPSIGPTPLTPIAQGVPLVGSMLTSYTTIGFFAKLPFQYGSRGIKQLAVAWQNNLTARCWDGEAAPSDEERLSDGGARPVVPVQPQERANAEYMTLDDAETCVPASAETLGAALDRVAESMRGQVPADKQGAFDAEVARLQNNARTARITNNFIMKEPEDLNPVLAYIDDPMITFAWGAVQGAVDGTASGTTAVADLTVGNGVDYTYVADSLVGMIVSKIWGTVVPGVELPVGTGTMEFSVVPNFPAVASYFSGQALDTYNNVLDTMCLVHPEDAETGE